MISFRHENSDENQLDEGPDDEDIEGPPPVCEIVDEASNDRSEFWSHAINMSAKVCL
jgi:hypothetical protein